MSNAGFSVESRTFALTPVDERRVSIASALTSAEAMLWYAALISVFCMARFLAFAWDGSDYLLAVANYSPHMAGNSLAYSPLFMIPAVGVARWLPLWLDVALFAVVYVAGWLMQLRVGACLACSESERRLLRLASPVIAFFPGLLVNDVILSGNVAYVLYGLMLGSALWGWRRQQWSWFYLAVLVAAMVKIHLLTMLAIPLLSGKRQRTPVLATGAAGLLLYGLQYIMWPEAFGVYAHALGSMSQSARDFGCGPAGNLARLLKTMGLPFRVASVAAYAVFASAMLWLLGLLARAWRNGKVSLATWLPVLLLGVLLLNPRILTYDAAPFSLAMLLVAWRALHDEAGQLRRPLLWRCVALLLAANVFLEINEDAVTMLHDAWKYAELAVLLTVFSAGVSMVLREAGGWVAIFEREPAPEYAELSMAD